MMAILELLWLISPQRGLPWWSLCWAVLRQQGISSNYPCYPGIWSFNPVLGSGYLKTSEPRSHWFQVLKKTRIEELPVLGTWKKINRNQTTVGSGCFKNLKEPPGPVKEPVKELVVSWAVIDFKKDWSLWWLGIWLFDNHDYSIRTVY
jgi:hypothetical protein